MKSWLKYLIFSLLVFGLIFAGRTIIIQYTFLLEACMAYDFFILIMSISTLLFIAVGVILGFEKLLAERKKKGGWRLDLPRALFMGVPSLYLSLILPLAYTKLGVIYNPIRALIIKGGMHGTDFVPAVQVILGYTIITSFYKEKSKKLKVKEDLGGNEVSWNEE